jgi:hypothetical protein
VSRHAELQGSYYLSGARKKIDVAAVPGFADVAARVKAEGRAGMHFDRFYTLWQAAQQAPAGRSSRWAHIRAGRHVHRGAS